MNASATHKRFQVDTRVIAASNRDLAEEIESERFREDLYYRLNVVPIVLPPLRQRREDIPALVGHFLNYYNEDNDRYVLHIQREAMTAMQDYDWPGNVRELQNYTERAVVMAEGDELTLDLLPDAVLGKQPTTTSLRGPMDLDSLTFELVREGLSCAGPQEDALHTKIVSRVEREVIAQVMAECNNVQTKAAKRLGINRNTLHKKLHEYDLEGSNS